MKKCLKCGNNVLPGSSTCPCCGNPIRGNVTTYRKKDVTTRYTNKNVVTGRSTIYDSHNNRGPATVTTNNGGAGCVVFFAFLMIVLPVLGSIGVFISEISDTDYNVNYNEDTEIDYETDYDNDIPSISDEELKDNVEIVKTTKTSKGDFIFIIKNNNDVDVAVTINMTSRDKNGSDMEHYTTRANLAANNEQIVTVSNFFLGGDFLSLAYKYSVTEEDYYDYGVLDVNSLTEKNENNRLTVNYMNNTGISISSMELCVVYYNKDSVVDYDCDIELSKEIGSNIEFSYYYGTTAKFDTYKYYLKELRFKK